MSSTTSELLLFSYGILPSLNTSHISTPRRMGECSTAYAKVHEWQTNKPTSRNHRLLDIKIPVPASRKYNNSKSPKLVRPVWFLKNRDLPTFRVLKSFQAQPFVTANSKATSALAGDINSNVYTWCTWGEWVRCAVTRTSEDCGKPEIQSSVLRGQLSLTASQRKARGNEGSGLSHFLSFKKLQIVGFKIQTLSVF